MSILAHREQNPNALTSVFSCETLGAMQSIALWLLYMILGEAVMTSVRTHVEDFWDDRRQQKQSSSSSPPTPYKAGDSSLECALCRDTITVDTVLKVNRARKLGWRVDPRDSFAYCPSCLSIDPPPQPDPLLGSETPAGADQSSA